MSYQEKKSLVSLLAGLAIFGVYYYRLCGQEPPVGFTEQVQYWCKAILVLLPVLIVCKIGIHIVFAMVNTMATREKEPGFMDERDKLIELKAIRNFCWVFFAGFFFALSAPLIGWSLRTLFEILLFTIIVAGSALDLSQLYFYRKGV